VIAHSEAASPWCGVSARPRRSDWCRLEDQPTKRIDIERLLVRPRRGASAPAARHRSGHSVPPRVCERSLRRAGLAELWDFSGISTDDGTITPCPLVELVGPRSPVPPWARHRASPRYIKLTQEWPPLGRGRVARPVLRLVERARVEATGSPRPPRQSTSARPRPPLPPSCAGRPDRRLLRPRVGARARVRRGIAHADACRDGERG